MILTCPECATRYEIDSAAFPAAGRKVRCKKCGHVWFQAGEQAAAAPAVQPEPVIAAADPDAVATAESAAEAVDTTPPEPETPIGAVRSWRAANAAAQDAEAQSAAQTSKPRASSSAIAMGLGWAALVVVILLIGWSATAFRQQIATAWPPSASLYSRIGMPVNTRGLIFGDMHHANTREDGQPVLEITGKLLNVTAAPVSTPRLRATLRDGSQHVLYTWGFSAGGANVAPGKSVAFHTRLSNPPAAARHVDIQFADSAQ